MVSTSPSQSDDSTLRCPGCAALLEALEEIEKGQGPYSLDRLTFAENTIEAMQAIATATIAEAKRAGAP